MDDTAVNLFGAKEVNFRLAQNYTSRGILRITEIQLKNCEYKNENYEEMDSTKEVRIESVVRAARAVISNADTCNHLLIKQGKDMGKLKTERNYWRVGGLGAFMGFLLMIFK
jgi:hypothetical protein